ncbi:hypothetical protein, partial [Pseudomonas laurylsulfatiphila]|uniref:hypothetical protein n=1 Tax=Pseudomonas laurylsulfatiphila TaxID=2011015 RepID=UPI003D0A5B0F
AGCDLLILIFRSFDIVKNQNQKIAACGSSYGDFCPSTILAAYPVNVGAAEGCDLLILILRPFDMVKIKIKRSQPAAAPTGKRIRTRPAG